MILSILAPVMAVFVVSAAASAPMADDYRALTAIEAESAAFIVEQASRPQPPTPPPIEIARAAYSDGYLKTSVPRDPSVGISKLQVDGAAGPIDARLYTPPVVKATKSGVLVYVHGGGFIVGDLDSHEPLLQLVAKTARIRVLAIAYRRAPEAKFPAARDDVAASVRWTKAHSAELKIDPNRIVIGGESAGAAHALSAAVALEKSDAGLLAGIWVLVPATDAAASGASHRRYATGAGRTAAEFQFLWGQYMPEGMAKTDPELSPLYADLKGLPPTKIFTAEFDPARDDGEQFAARAKSQGVAVSLRRERGLIHQFPEITGRSKASRDAVIRAAQDLRKLAE